jgi:hypothetical protein
MSVSAQIRLSTEAGPVSHHFNPDKHSIPARLNLKTLRMLGSGSLPDAILNGLCRQAIQ